MGDSSLGGKGRKEGMDGVKRAWDWRRGMSRDAKGEDVCRMLRLGVAKELERVWSGSQGGLV